MKKVEFTIDHIDPLGQGISKTDDQVCFIEKALPGESGSITPIKSKKKGRLIFSRALPGELTKQSPSRIEPVCKHFFECSGCHYLHTDYNTESSIKHDVAKRMFKWVDQLNCEVDYITAPNRLEYRNRIQLHYDKETKELGLIDSLHSRIRSIESCQVINKSVSEKVKELYNNEAWISYLNDEPNKGHIEIYDLDGKVQLSANKRYSDGGFTQVNEQMNKKMLSHLEEQVRENVPEGTLLLDLFGGAGNLSKNLEEFPTLVIDGFPPKKMDFRPHQKFEKINLYSKDAIDLVQERVAKQPLAIILDPPRSGLKNIEELITKLSPSFIFMINCEGSSAIRDLKSIEKSFSVENLTIFDLFPGTRHFETFSTLRFG